MPRSACILARIRCAFRTCLTLERAANNVTTIEAPDRRQPEETVRRTTAIMAAACCALLVAAPAPRAGRDREGRREISPDAEGRSVEQSRLARRRPRRGAVEDGRPARTRPRWRNAISARGPGVVDGAFAELPRYFADADKVMDLETRLLWCMEKLQGFNRADLVKRPHPAGGQPVKDLGAIATYVASKSSGMKYAAKLDTPQEKAVVELGQAMFFRRQGPHDFACATCHADSGKRIRLQGLPYLSQTRGGEAGHRPMAGLSRVDHACDDHAAPAVRLLLADADAGAGNGVGRERRADRLSHQERPRAARSPLRASSAERGRHDTP